MPPETPWQTVAGPVSAQPRGRYRNLFSLQPVLLAFQVPSSFLDNSLAEFARGLLAGSWEVCERISGLGGWVMAPARPSVKALDASLPLQEQELPGFPGLV